MSLAIELSGVTVRYRGAAVLDDVSLEVQSGDYFGLIGPNGGGKSTLLRVILGLVHPGQGEVRLFGGPPEAGRRDVGYVPQFARFDLDFPVSVTDVVRMGRLGRGRGRRALGAEDRQAAADALAQLDVAHLAARPIGSLSGGELQRVLIARALAGEPKLLLLDEPAASLDVRGGRSFHELLADLATRITVVLVSHDIGVVSAYVRHVACLNRRLYRHPSGKLVPELLEEAYGCPVHLLPHTHERLGGGAVAEESCR